MLRDINCKCEIIKNFSPAWFASVMGTGIFAMTSLSFSEYIPFLKTIASILFYLNLILFFLLLVPWLLRWTLFRNEAMKDLENPLNSNFYSTIAVAMLVLAANFIFIADNMLLGEIFWFAGTFSTIFFGIVIPYYMFKGEHVKLDHISPAWFIPPVGLIVIPIAGSSIIPQFSGTLKEFVIFLNYFGWGAGFFIYLALLAISMYRFILHHPLPSTLSPTIWINLGPIGAGTVALVNLVNSSSFVTVKQPFFVFGLLFWGFGIWWVLIAIVMSLHYIKKLSLPYAMSWWAFTFPLGAYVAASHSISKIFNIELVNYVGFALYWLLAILWTVTFVKTAVNAYHGTLFKER
ncbi:MAG: C4-dicarboxylate ABC transporter [Thermotogae bacterium]|uniref:tellurite-resistance/dicarboxylate transporter n=1 Tax=Kosmotoga sp. TaxID=1955248 RepID=UPI000F1317A8|nr:tellurite-resistance/dicarboxylate transporter [Kosmotoga sp.]MBO8166727.1 C4-dicarboxylate ABC transporter [Kosmotoga sp.]RKX47749.1 MAG: C4-dicarboxylate ABC transporter [Thermotogota bacterium]